MEFPIAYIIGGVCALIVEYTRSLRTIIYKLIMISVRISLACFPVSFHVG
jgi:hypothetical protein